MSEVTPNEHQRSGIEKYASITKPGTLRQLANGDITGECSEYPGKLWVHLRERAATTQVDANEASP